MSIHDASNERDWVVAAQRDPAAFGPLYDRYVDRIYGFLFRRTAGDLALTQDLTAAVFEAALRGLPRYRWQGVPFGAWLFRIARSEIASHYRRRTPSYDLQDAALPSPAPASDDAADLARGLARLSETDRELLSLKFFDDLPTPVLADVLGISPEAVYVRVHRALSRLKAALADEEVDHAP